jgi:c-di-GMP-binding flagellar brake protein YcgR
VTEDERRRFRRIGSHLRCWIRGESRTVYVTLRDLSPGGAGISAPTTFHRGEAAEVLLQDPHHSRSLRARAEVAWSHPDSENPAHAGTGVRFLEVLEGQELLPGPE